MFNKILVNVFVLLIVSAAGSGVGYAFYVQKTLAKHETKIEKLETIVQKLSSVPAVLQRIDYRTRYMAEQLGYDVEKLEGKEAVP